MSNPKEAVEQATAQSLVQAVAIAAGPEDLALMREGDYRPADHLIWSNEHSAWWRPNSHGYTTDLLSAGLYTRKAAVSIANMSGHGRLKEEAIPVSNKLAELDELSRKIDRLVTAAWSPAPGTTAIGLRAHPESLGEYLRVARFLEEMIRTMPFAEMLDAVHGSSMASNHTRQSLDVLRSAQRQLERYVRIDV